MKRTGCWSARFYHRTKNHLGLVASLLNLQADQVQDPRDAELFKDARGRVITLSRRDPRTDACYFPDPADRWNSDRIAGTGGRLRFPDTPARKVDGDGGIAEGVKLTAHFLFSYQRYMVI